MVNKYFYHLGKAKYIGVHLLHKPGIGTKRKLIYNPDGKFKPNYIITIRGKIGTFTVRFIHKIIIFMNLQPGINEGSMVK